MKIAIDISQIAYKGTGVGRFITGLTNAILTYGNGDEWTFFFSSLRQQLAPEIRREIKKHDQRLAEYRLPPSALSFLWNSVHRMKIEKLVGKQDFILTSDWTEPPSRHPKATVIHDLAYLRFPETVHPLIRKTQTERMKWVVKESKIIFADSQATKKDVMELLHVPGEKIHVNYPGVEIAMAAPEEMKKTLSKFAVAKPFILTVGKIEPRKNLARLLDAFHALNDKGLELLVVGTQGWDKVTSKEKSERKNVRFLGYVSETELSALYRSCLIFAFPSLFEGFGYPVIEAMMAGAPVVASDTSSLTELGKDAALLFNPHDTVSIQSALVELIHDKTKRETLSKKGIIRSRDFGWKQYYEKMAGVFQTVTFTSA